jgi:hypothetical protein
MRNNNRIIRVMSNIIYRMSNIIYRMVINNNNNSKEYMIIMDKYNRMDRWIYFIN